MNDKAIVTIYETGTKTSDIMKQLDINFLDVRSIDETTLLLRPDQYKMLLSKAPYLISMAVTDISKFEKESFEDGEKVVSQYHTLEMSRQLESLTQCLMRKCIFLNGLNLKIWLMAMYWKIRL